MNNGHRERLRNRLLENGGNSLVDHELLEILLFNAIPRKDTKKIAKLLLQEYSSLEQLFYNISNRCVDRKKISKSMQATITCVTEIIYRISQSRIKKRNVFHNWRQILDHLMVFLGNREIECFYVLFLNSNNIFIADVLYEGTLNRVALYHKEILKKAISINASNIIISHNHPSDNINPSEEDIASTKELRKFCASCHIVLLDHIIVTRNNFYSLSENGLI